MTNFSCNGCQWSNPDTCRMCRAEQEDFPIKALKIKENLSKMPIMLLDSVVWELDELDKALIARQKLN